MMLEHLVLRNKSTLQKLWSDYGEISRCFSSSLNTPVIVKHIRPPKSMAHPRGWHSAHANERKISSYQNELCFYQHFSQRCTTESRVPAYITSEELRDNEFVLVLEDLSHAGYAVTPERIDFAQVKVAIKWLAAFHARFLTCDIDALWRQGTYWYLATRGDEYQAMAESPLKKHAQRIDQALRNTRFQTLLHGDAKLANLCFSADLQDVAAVDFQYTGKGVGVQDLAYFVGSCMNSEQLFHYHDAILTNYFDNFKAYSAKLALDSFDALEQEWRELYPIAWADFHRFLTGWQPDHGKINPYMQQQTQIALRMISS